MNAQASQALSSYDASDGQPGVFDVLMVIDRSGFGPPDGNWPPTHPMDKFVDSLGRHLYVFKDILPYVVTTQEIAPEDELQVPSYAVVTNDRDYADWCHSGGGDLVEFNHTEEFLTIKSRGQTEQFSITDVASAVVYAADKIKPPSDQSHQEADSAPVALDTGTALLQPISLKEFRGTELILAELWQAIENDELSDTQEYQVIAMAKLLDSERRATVPKDTERWVLVALFQAVIKCLLELITKSASLWPKILEILHAIDWESTSALLSL